MPWDIWLNYFVPILTSHWHHFQLMTFYWITKNCTTFTFMQFLGGVIILIPFWSLSFESSCINCNSRLQLYVQQILASLFKSPLGTHGADTSVSDVSFWIFSQGSYLCSGRHCLRRQLAGRGALSLFTKQKLFIHPAMCVNWTLFPLLGTQLKPHNVCNQVQTQTNSNNLIDNIIYKTNRQYLAQ